MAKITYQDKTIGSKWKAIDANEVKESVNDLYDELEAGTNVIKNQSDEIQNASFSIGNSGHIGGLGAEETFVSPQITGHQGYTTDGTFHYITDTARIDKRNNDGSWSVALSNNSPFTGVAGVNHLGDCDYSAGLVYVPAETYNGCGSVSGQKILTFNSTTLALVNQFDISAQAHEASAIAIDAVNNIAYVSSYCDGSQLWKYNATTFAFLGTLSLSNTLFLVQGLSYDAGVIYIASGQDGIYTCNPTTGQITFVLAPKADFPTPEGLGVVNGQIRWLIDNVGDGTNSNVHFFDPSDTPQGFYTDQSGLSYFGSNLRIGSRLQVNSESNIGLINLSGPINKPKLFLEEGDSAASIGHDEANTFLTKNAYYDGTWLRHEVSKVSNGLFLNDSDRFEFRYAAAGANPLIWTTPMFINGSSGKITVNNTTDGVFTGTGSVATDQLSVLRNVNTLGASSAFFSDDTNTKGASVGVVNSASTLGASYGLAGEGFIRSTGASNGLHLSASAGPMRFSVSTGTEAMRIFQSTRNITIAGTTDAGFKLDVIGSSRVTTLRATTSLTVGDGTNNPQLLINGANLANREIYFQTNGSNRWTIKANNANESGGNNGSNFEIVARDDAGATITTAVTIARATGQVIVGSMRATQYNLTALNTAPATATSTGTLGEIRYTATHIYLCTATNTWVRAALATF